MAAVPPAYNILAPVAHLDVLAEAAHAPSVYAPQLQFANPGSSILPPGHSYSTMLNANTYGQQQHVPLNAIGAAPSYSEPAQLQPPPSYSQQQYFVMAVAQSRIASPQQQWMYSSVAGPHPGLNGAPAVIQVGAHATSVAVHPGSQVAPSMTLQPTSGATHVSQTSEPPLPLGCLSNEWLLQKALARGGDGRAIGEPLLKQTQDGKMAPVQTANPRGKRAGQRRNQYTRAAGAIGEPLISEAMMREFESQNKRAKLSENSTRQ
jgi:hypothetical protein